MSVRLGALLWFAALASGREAAAATAPAGPSNRPPAPAQSGPAATPAPGAGPLYIQEYRVEGAHQLPRMEIEAAVYPYLGPGRSPDDVEQARAALEKAYRDKGYQAASVQIPEQKVKGGVVFLKVDEGIVGRLRVREARYFLPDRIKSMAPSLAEGRVINFNEVTRDIVALNQLPDRRVTPTLRAGVVPGTVDIDLNVKDTFPLHGDVELNNRYSADTKALRLNGSLNYGNLWQLGHSIGASFQIAPEDTNEVTVFSGYYLARFPAVDWLTLTLQGTKQESNVSTLSSVAIAGRGQVLGLRAGVTLPPGKDFYHSLSVGFDYKHFDQNVLLAGTEILSPITYYPISAIYSATWAAKGALTEFNGGVTFSIRGTGSNQTEFDNSRFNASGNFIYVRADLAHTHDLPLGFQLFGKVQGQIADQPLVSSEQFSGGGLGTVRGYLEAEVPGDNALFGSLELRSPSLLEGWAKKAGEWRIYVFTDAGALTIRDPLPDQSSRFSLASFGVGSRIQLLDHLNGSIDAAMPLIGQTTTTANSLLVTFRVWADF